MIGDKIRTLRRKRGLSQDQLGAMLGFSQSKISKIENGDWDSLSDLRLIAKALEVPIEELITDHSDEVNIPGLGNRESGKMETGIPAGWKPLFR